MTNSKEKNLKKEQGVKKSATETDKNKKRLSKLIGEILAKTKKGLLENISILQILGLLLMAWGVYVGLIIVNVLPFQYVILDRPLSSISIVMGIASFIFGYWLFKA